MASHVLHRFLVPRHPPCALKNLATDARVHCAVLKQRPTTHHPHNQVVEFTGVGAERPSLTAVPSGPNNVPHTHHPHQPALHTPKRSTGRPEGPKVPNSQRSTHEQPYGTFARKRLLLLRKEVIQPHLPVRLPCYDFVPIAGPTFDSSSPYGLGHRLRVLPTFVT